MGKKVQGAKLRAKKRARVAVEELQEHQAERAIAKSATEQAIFVFDTTGDAIPDALKLSSPAVKKQQQQQRLKKQKQPLGLSEREQHQVQRLLDKHKHDATKLQEIASTSRTLLNHRIEQGRLIRSSSRTTTRTTTNGVGGDRRLNKTMKNNFDLWINTNTTTTTTTDINNNDDKKQAAVTPDSNTEEKDTDKLNDHISPGIGSSLAGTRPQHSVTKAKTVAMLSSSYNHKNDNNNKKKNPSIAVDVAQSAGQSYHPDPVAHAALLQQAAAAELLREQAVRNLKSPIGAGMSEETRALLVGSSSDEGGSDDDDNNEDSINKNNILSLGVIPKRVTKLTKAQRNKQKRIKQEMIEVAKRRSDKKLLKQAGNIHRITKELRKEQQLRQEQKVQLGQKKQDDAKLIVKKGLDLKAFQKDPLLAPTVPVALLPLAAAAAAGTSSLRTLRPKGSLVTDRIASYTDRNILDLSSKKRKASSRISVQEATAFDISGSNIGKPKKKNKTRKALKGKRNQDWKGADFEIKGC